MSGTGRPKVAVLGGGMAALTAAFELSQGDWTEHFDSITVYQRGWRLGGKGASGRGDHGRIEEHGLHVLLGYYDRTFDLMRRCYTELDRPGNDPTCPILTWDDAVAPSNLVGVTERAGDGWASWVASFSRNTRPAVRHYAPDPAGIAVRSVGLLVDFFASLAPRSAPARGSVYLSTSPEPATVTAVPDPAAVFHGASLAGLAIPLSLARRMTAWRDRRSPDGVLNESIPDVAGPLRAALRAATRTDPPARRTHDLVELVTTNLIGIVADRLLLRPDGLAAIDDLDYRDWLSGHGMDPEALGSPLLRGMYDLVFGYESGDPNRPSFSAGLGLQLATHMLLGYSGALFWKMQAGMGDTIFAPLYQVLRSRGVAFRFFHRVDAIRLDRTATRVAAIDVGVQADPDGGPGAYDPLIRVRGLPCWPAAPLAGRLRDPGNVAVADPESFWSPRADTARATLIDGHDFDAVVFGISLGMVPHVCGELLAASPAWRDMVANVGTVATQALQLWLRASEPALGWAGAPGVTVSGFGGPFSTWASMSHLLDVEAWPEKDGPRSLAYFCGPLAPVGPHEASDRVGANVDEFLEHRVGGLWPGFRADMVSSRYRRANVDPSDLYVQSLPGSAKYRLKPGGTGFDNLVVAGDWTDCGLNAGCVEAATLSGQLAAAAVVERLGAGGASRA